MNTVEVEVETPKSPDKVPNEEVNDAITSLRASQTIYVPPMTQVPVMVRCKRPGLVHTETKPLVFVNHHLKITNGIH